MTMMFMVVIKIMTYNNNSLTSGVDGQAFFIWVESGSLVKFLKNLLTWILESRCLSVVDFSKRDYMFLVTDILGQNLI
jgi:hypothetical protein